MLSGVYPSVDDHLAHEVLAAIGVAADDGVDFHSVLIVDGHLLDPYLGPSAPVPPGHDVVRQDAWAAWIPGDGPGGRSDHLGLRGGGGTFRYDELRARIEHHPDRTA